MVAIVSGNALGLNLGSLATLGQRGVNGGASGGRSGELAYVNAATGNLVLQDRDDALVGRGLSIGSVRTYNSLGKLTDDNADNWSIGIYAQQLKLTGTRNVAGSTLVRTDRDGAQSTYAYDATLAAYVSKEGAGAYDRIVYDTVTAQYVWTDGDTGSQERYDSAATGRLLSLRDTSGNTLSYTYNAAGLLTSVTDANGEQTFYDYTGTNLTQIRSVVTNAGVSQTLTRVRYAYDTSNRLSTVTVDLSPADNVVADGKTYTTTYTYDGTSKRVASVTQQDGTSLTFTYVLVGTDYRVASVRDALGNLTSFAYNTTTRRTTVTDPLLLATLYDYDAAGQLLKVTAPAVGGVSQSTTFAYSANGDLSQVTDGEGRVVTYGYDASGNQVLQRDTAGNTVTRTFDARNQLTTETAYVTPDPDGAGVALPGTPLTSRFVYDAGNKNLLRFVLSPEGRVTEHQYNAFGQRTSSIQYAGAAYAVSALAATAVPTEAELVTWVGTQDRTRTQRMDMVYDARGQLQRTTAFAATDALGTGLADGNQSVTQYVYDQAGLLLQTISPTVGTTTFVYDGLGRVISSTAANGVVTLTAYDDVGNKTKVTLANGLSSTSTYDRGGRLVSVLQSNAAAATLGETKYFYDADNRLRMTQDPTGVRSWALYDEASRKVADIDGNGSLTEYVYDKNNQVTQTIAYATAVNTATLVDLAGNPTNPALATVRPLANAADRKAWRAYDSANRLVKTVDAAGAVTETVYDGASRAVKLVRYSALVATATLGSAPTAAVIAPVANAAADRVGRSFFDNDGRLLAQLDGEGYLTEYQYDSAGRQTVALRYATQTASANWAAGTLAVLRPVAAAGDIRSTTFYNGRGLVAAVVDGENYLTERVYDTAGNLTRQVRYATKLVATVTPTTTLVSIRPAANAEDQVTARVYDQLNRVTQETNAEGTVTQYVYDNAGNLVTTTRAVGQAEVRAINARFDLQGRLVGELTAEGSALLTGTLTQAQIDVIWAQHGLTHAYDAAGRRISTTDQNANKTLFFYDADGQLTHVVNPLGEVDERQYDTLGQLAATVRYGTRIALTGLTGGLVNATLTNAINLVRNAALDRKATITYNTTGTVASSSDALGNLTTSAYNAFGAEVSRTTALGNGLTRADSSTYDRRGLQVATLADVGGIAAASSATFDAFGRQTMAVDGNGNIRRQSYDRDGRVVQTIDGVVATRSSTYDAFDRVLTQTNALGQVTSYAYSTSARSVTVTTPEGVVVKTVRTRHGQTFTVTDGKNQVTTYTYDRNGNLLTTATPLTTTRQAFDRASRLIETTDARGVKVSYGYDTANRVLTRRLDPTGLNLTTTYAYDALGQAVSVTDPAGIVTTTAYDLKGQVLRQTVDPAGLNLQTVYTYDGRGKTLTVTSPKGTVTQYVYDKLGRRVQERVDPAGLNITRSYTYDKNGNVATRTDANARLTRFAYDGENRLLFTVDALGNTTRNEYDAQGRLTRTTQYARPINTATLPTPATAAQITALLVLTAGKDAIVANRYDRNDRLRYSVDGTGAVVEFKYDANNNVVERIAYANAVNLATWTGATDPVVTADATRDQRTRTVYDALDRATHVADAVGAVTQRVYDANGNITKVVEFATAVAAATSPSAVVANAADRTSVFTYDNANRETWRADSVGAVTRSEYDADGNLVRSTQFFNTVAVGGTPSTVVANAVLDRATSHTYDKANRRTYTVDALNYVRRNVYDGEGQVTSTTRYATAIAAGALPTTVVANATLDRTDSFVYDKGGRLASSTDALGFVEAFTYDGQGNKLTFTNKKGSVWTYAYDAAGRLVSETSPQVALTAVTEDAAGKLTEGLATTASVVTQLAYDALGNLTSRTEAAGRTEQRVTSYEYDARGRQTKVTYPAVGVYTETVAALAANGQASQALRTEATRALFALTYYDALSNAVANLDVAGGVSFKTYDLAGRVLHEVDALGHVTGYTRNAFGDTTAVLRYALPTTLANTVPTSAAQAPSAAAVLAAVNAVGVNHAFDRLLTTTYDRLGRATDVVEPTAYTFDSDTNLSDIAGRTTKNSYNSFGELVKTSVLKNRLANTWVDGYNYFDKLGRQSASIDGLGYLTQRTYDAVGNLTASTEYATAATAGTWSVSGYTAPGAVASDRTTTYAYDRGNRKTSETRVNVEFSTVANGTSASGNLTTSYGYDAVGNLTRTTDAAGGSVYSYYDALGRVTAVAAPSRTSTASGAALIPLSIFKRDAYGNVVAKIDMANSAVSAAEFTGVSTAAAPGYASGLADTTNDRATVSKFDAMGRAMAVTDAAGFTHFSAYNERGQLAKTWQAVTGNEGTVSTIFQAYQYDKLGHLTHTLDPAPLTSATAAGVVTTTTQALAGVVDTALEYNAFGELVRKGVNGGRQEYFDYDNSGALWRTNSGDGNVKVVLHDLMGRSTADIRSSGSGRDDRDLSLLAVDQVAALTTTRRTDTRFDALGRVVMQSQPERTDAQAGVTVRRQLNTAAFATTASKTFDESGNFTGWSSNNQVNLSWTSLGGLGSGDVKIELEYWTAPQVLVPGTTDEAGNVITPPVYSTPVARWTTQIFTAEEAAAGRALVWAETAGNGDGGVSAAKRLMVSKKDINGGWQRVIDQSSFGYAGNTVEIAAPTDPGTVSRFEMRIAGSGSAFSPYATVNFGSALRYDASALALGSYEYRVMTTVTGQAERLTASGTLTLTSQPLAAIGSLQSYGLAGAGVLAWQTPGTAVVQRLNYRVSGSTGAWSSLAVASRNATYDGVATTGLAAGTYQYELIWTRAGEAAPYAHATGTFTVVAAIAPVPVPAVGTPNITGIAVSPTALSWTAVAGTPAFQYRATGAPTWTTLAVTTAAGRGSANTSALTAGTYEFRITYTSGTTTVALGTGNLTVNPQGAGHYETVTVTVMVPVTVTPPNPANYIVGYTRATYSAPVFVGTDESGQPILGAHYAWSGNVVVGVPYTESQVVGYTTQQVPVYGPVTVTPPNPANYITGSTRASYSYPIVTGHDESGQPILAPNYAWSGSYVVAVPYSVYQIIRYDTVTVPVQVPTQGPPVIAGYDEAGQPIYARDEAGNIIYTVVYVTQYQTQQVPVYGYVTVTPPSPAPYMTVAPKPTYSAPVVVGYDGAGNPILGAHYAWQGNQVVAVPYTENQIVGYTTQQVPVYGNVTVNPPNPANYLLTAPKPLYSAPIVVGTDESGNQILAAHYVWQGNAVVGVPYTELQPQQQQQQVWVPGTTPPPTVAITTPPYTAGYTIPGTPAQYSNTSTTVANTPAISLGGADPGAILSQSATVNGSSVWLRPVLNQKVDRWGNVLEVNDPRNVAWKTTYRWNFNNQLIYEQKPDAAGAQSAGSPISQTYYDQLGRQVATRDANGNVNGQVFDSGGNLIQENHADNGVVTHRYNAFGERVATVDALGNAVGATAQTKTNHTSTFVYDKMSRLLSTTRGPMNVYTITAGMVVSAPVWRNVTESFTYDGAGRKLKQIDGDGRVTKYKYDLAGHVVETTLAGRPEQPITPLTTSKVVYDALGHKTAEIDANGLASTWVIDYFGRATSHKDIGGATVSYGYDNAKQLRTQTSTRGQSLRYDYDAAGQVVTIADLALAKTTSFAYDLAGRHVAERTVQAGVVYQDNHLAYDTVGRLRDVADGRVHISISYDKNGNRTFVGSHVNVLAAAGATTDTSRDTNRYFKYDQMNRQTVVDGIDALGNLGQQGHAITYDLNGNRKTDTFWGNRVATSGGQQVIIGYDENGEAIYSTTPYTYTTSQALVVETYGYSNLDRLVSVVRDGVQVDHREYDAAGRVIQTGPQGNLPVGYAAALNSGVAQGSGIGLESRRNRFDDFGRLLHQTVLKSDNTIKNEIDYSSYDAAGNVLRYTLTEPNNYTNTYVYTLARYEGYVEQQINGSSTLFQPGVTTNGYDVNGNLVSVTDSTKAANNRTFVNDSVGRALYANQNGNVQRQLVVNGEVLGRYGVGIDEVSPRVGDGDPNFKPLADFDFGFQPINGNYPTASPGVYAVKAGDTLASIARGAYGDSQLWYRIAEANSLSSDRDLRVGQTLTIPNKVSTVHNNADTYKPYDPSKITGDTTPNLAAPQNDDDCGGLGQILMIVVAIVVTVVSYGALAELGYGLVAAGAISGAAGALASQVVGNAIGVMDGFDWKGIALGAIGGAVSGGLAGWNPLGATASNVANTVVRAAVGNALTQGIAVVTGLQKEFSWRGVAAAAVSAGVGEALGATAMRDDDGNLMPLVKGQQPRWSGTGVLADLSSQGGLGQLAAGTLTGLATGATAAIARGGRIDVKQIAIDAFGNALGNGLADVVETASRQESARRAALATSQSTGDSGGREFADWLGAQLEEQKAADRATLQALVQRNDGGSAAGDFALAGGASLSEGWQLTKVGFGSSQASGQSFDADWAANEMAKQHRFFDEVRDFIRAKAEGAVSAGSEWLKSQLDQHPTAARWLEAVRENGPAMMAAIAQEGRENAPAIARDVGASLALVAFDIINTPVSPTPDTSILAAGIAAVRLDKAIGYAKTFGQVLDALKTFDLNSTMRHLVGQVDDLAKVKSQVDRALGANGIERESMLRAVPGLETSGVREAVERAQELGFTAIDSVIDKASKGSSVVRIFGQVAAKTGFFGELVTAKALEYSGLVDPGSIAGLQNNSNHGVDLFAKARTGRDYGKWLAFEVKTSDNGWAPRLSDDQSRGSNWYARSRLQRASAGGSHWVPGLSADRSVGSFADRILADSNTAIPGYAVFNSYTANKRPSVEYIEWKPAVRQPPSPWGTMQHPRFK